MKNILLILGSLQLLFASCNKQDEWLDIKSNKSDVTPSTLRNYQAILDYDGYMNSNYPGLPLVSADNYYVNYTTWQGTSNYAKYAYTWDKDIYQGTTGIPDWNSQYAVIEYSNIVLDGLATLDPASQNSQDGKNAMGSALFFRAYAFYNLAAEFAPPYTSAGAATDLGIPLRLSSDINQVSTRATLKQTYDQIISDLKQAETLLPVTALYQARPSSVSADALLARVYLNMEDYANALVYADKALSVYHTLIDFNSLTLTAAMPLPAYPNNTEVIFYSASSLYTLAILTGLVDTALLKSYVSNDLRKPAFYSTTSSGTTFKGQYTGSYNPFGGLAVNELYLIRAESYARANNTTAALQDLNTLLIKRWKTGTFVPYTATDANDALGKILAERRKELPFTGSLRWEDLRRLNKDSKYAVTLTRVLNGQTYTLPPGDSRYTLPIPDIEIKLSGIAQNPR